VKLESSVFARLPRGGLGNKLLVWARALVFAHKFGLPLYVSGWSDIRIGPYLRLEPSKRQYWGYFEGGDAPSLLRRFMFSRWCEVHHEPDLECELPAGPQKAAQLYLFDTVPSWHDYFQGLRGNEELVRSSFCSLLQSQYRKELICESGPIIGVHVRRSDFRELAPGESIGENCNVRMPIAYYLDVINALRRMAGRKLQAMIFTDGRHEDVAELLALPDVTMAAPNSDVVDLILLSKSKYLVTSFGSTFSYWAAYLSDGIVITHPAQVLTIRSEAVNKLRYEGPISCDQPWDPVLANQVGAISSRLP
jgi:hypothetical protein